VLDIGSTSITFDGGENGTDWGLISLDGKITSSTHTIRLDKGASIASTADIASAGNANYAAIYNLATGGGYINISGGTLQSAIFYAVYNSSTGKTTVSDSAKVRGIYLGAGLVGAEILEITGGTVEASSKYAVNNQNSGTVNISGGEVKAAEGANYTIVNGKNGVININGGTVSAINNAAIVNADDGGGVININGGKVSSISHYAIWNSTLGTVNINDGEVSTATGIAINNRANGVSGMLTRPVLFPTISLER